MSKSCFIFGHGNAPDDIKENIKEKIHLLITQNDVDFFWTGGYDGFEQFIQDLLQPYKEKKPLLSIQSINDFILTILNSDSDIISNDCEDYPIRMEIKSGQFFIYISQLYMSARLDYAMTYIDGEYGNRYESYNISRMNKKLIYTVA